MKIKTKIKKRKLGKGFSLKTSRGFPINDVNSFEKSGDYVFWLIHGLNYLHSDFEKAIWSPLYNIYDGKVPEIAEVQRKLQENFLRNGKFTPMGKILGVWLSQDPGEVYSIYKNTLVTIRKTLRKSSEKAELLIRSPHFGLVWEIFQEMKERSLLILGGHKD